MKKTRQLIFGHDNLQTSLNEYENYVVQENWNTYLSHETDRNDIKFSKPLLDDWCEKYGLSMTEFVNSGLFNEHVEDYTIMVWAYDYLLTIVESILSFDSKIVRSRKNSSVERHKKLITALKLGENEFWIFALLVYKLRKISPGYISVKGENITENPTIVNFQALRFNSSIDRIILRDNDDQFKVEIRSADFPGLKEAVFETIKDFFSKDEKNLPLLYSTKNGLNTALSSNSKTPPFASCTLDLIKLFVRSEVKGIRQPNRLIAATLLTHFSQYFPSLLSENRWEEIYIRSLANRETKHKSYAEYLKSKIGRVLELEPEQIISNLGKF